MNIREYIREKLNDEQAKTAFHTDTPSLIIAGAWSGKTRVLTYKIAYLIRGLGTPFYRILGVTFTNKAANEMKERLIQIFDELDEKGIEGYEEQEEKTGDEAMDFIMEMNATTSHSHKKINQRDLKRIGTFHSIFLKMLKEDIEELGMKYTKDFSVLDMKDGDSIVKELIKKFDLKDKIKEAEIKGYISKQKNLWFSAKDLMKGAMNDEEGMKIKLYAEYEKQKELSNTLDFDDLLLFPYLLFKKKPEVLEKWQNKFDYILVDEAQDTNGVQFDLMKLLSAKGTPITLIGDDFQSIYMRRWAVLENFLHVDQYRKDIEIFKLQTNYRSRAFIVNAWNAVIKNNRNQYEKNIVAFNQGDENDKIKCFIHESDIEEAINIADLIQKLKEKNKIRSYGDVAILYRKNARSAWFEKIFVEKGMPYLIHGSFKFFERAEIRDMVAYLTYFLNPRDTLAFKRILNVPNRKVGETTLGKIMEYSEAHTMSLFETIDWMRKGEIPTSDLKVTPAALEWVKNFRLVTDNLMKQLESMTPADFIELLIKEIKYKDHLLKECAKKEEEAEERYENIGQLINFARKIQEVGKEGLESFMSEVALMNGADDDDNESDKIQLMTIHSSKGLEFPFVFIVGLEDGTFPWRKTISDPTELEEERRLMYVAITRAKERVFFSRAELVHSFGSEECFPESRFSLEVPESLKQEYDLSGTSGSTKHVDFDSFSVGDRVIHSLFWEGTILDIRNDMSVVKFDIKKVPVKMELKYLNKK